MTADLVRYDQVDGRSVYVDLDTIVALLDVFKSDQRGPVPQVDRTKCEIVTRDGDHYFVTTPAADIAPWVVASPAQRQSMLEKLKLKKEASDDRADDTD